MLQKITVFFDGHTLQPEILLDLEPNQHYVITVEAQITDSQSEDGSGPVEVEAFLNKKSDAFPHLANGRWGSRNDSN